MEAIIVPPTIRLLHYCNERAQEVTTLLNEVDIERIRSTGGGRGLRRKVRAYKPKLKFRQRRKRRTISKNKQISERSSRGHSLNTHRWYSKRFQMDHRWGFILPIRSRSVSASVPVSVLRNLPEHCVIHDASYYRPLLVTCYMSEMELLLSHVSDPDLVANIFYQLRESPCHRQHVIPVHRKGHYPQGFITFCSTFFISLASSSSVSLVFWIHPAVLSESLAELKLAFNDSSIEGDVTTLTLQRIDICGGRSQEVLARTLSLDRSQLHAINEGTAAFFICEDPRILKHTLFDCSSRRPLTTNVPLPEINRSNDTEDSMIKKLLSVENKSELPLPVHASSAYNRSSKRLAMYLPDCIVDKEQKSVRRFPQNTKNIVQGSSGDVTRFVSPHILSATCCLVANWHSGIPSYSLCIASEWIMPFWTKLARTGGRAAGIDEWSAVQDAASNRMKPEMFIDLITHNHALMMNEGVENRREILYSRMQLHASRQFILLENVEIPLKIQLISKGKCLVNARVLVRLPIERGDREVLYHECGTVIHTFSPGVREYPGGWALCSIALLSEGLRRPINDIFDHTSEIAMVIKNPGSNAFRRAISKIESADDSRFMEIIQ